MTENARRKIDQFGERQIKIKKQKRNKKIYKKKTIAEKSNHKLTKLIKKTTSSKRNNLKKRDKKMMKEKKKRPDGNIKLKHGESQSRNYKSCSRLLYGVFEYELSMSKTKI